MQFCTLFVKINKTRATLVIAAKYCKGESTENGKGLNRKKRLKRIKSFIPCRSLLTTLKS